MYALAARRSVTSRISRGVERNKSHLDTRHHVSQREFTEHTGWCEQRNSFFSPHHLMNQKDKDLGLQPEKKTSLVPSRNIIFIFYKAFFITAPQHTLYITRYEPQAAVPQCASHGLAAFPAVAQQHWQKHTQNCPVALHFAQGKHAANVAPRDTKDLYQVGRKNLALWGSLV